MDERQFASMASQFLRSSLDSWRRPQGQAFAVLHAGIGCEHLIKALLCRYDPLLISDKADWSHRFHALGFGDAPGVKALSEAKTIGMVEAFKIASTIMRGRMPIDEKAFRPVADARNSVAHYAYHDEQASRTVLESGLRVVEAVRAELGLDPAAFWGEFRTVFSDLDKVAANPSRPAWANRPSLEVAAEEKALVERATARSVLSAAVAAAIELSPWGFTDRADSHEHAAVLTALVTGLRVAGARARQSATDLLTEYGVLPFPARPDSTHASPGINQRAKTAMAVKVLISSSVIAGLVDISLTEHPDLPILKIIDTIDRSGWLRGRQGPDDDYLGWRECPACGYSGTAGGNLTAVPCECFDTDCEHPGHQLDVGVAESFSCLFCGLALTDGEEVALAGVAHRDT
ncbi:hypothetical protein [Kitasatospora purpeofusca]|uniref:hypothetical protein n=1 Tax=Kitasatospora purpeofusca TaxID=67352 RepID=UPI002A5A8AF5|nr:hypothetical protein [Kitasatospora purpeofusca]MDY0816070.1 hypothetical protein [Kitasatospora purpeofusca]